MRTTFLREQRLSHSILNSFSFQSDGASPKPFHTLTFLESSNPPCNPCSDLVSLLLPLKTWASTANAAREGPEEPSMAFFTGAIPGVTALWVPSGSLPSSRALRSAASATPAPVPALPRAGGPRPALGLRFPRSALDQASISPGVSCRAAPRGLAGGCESKGARWLTNRVRKCQVQGFLLQDLSGPLMCITNLLLQEASHLSKTSSSVPSRTNGC